MMPELGHYLLCPATGLALLLGIYPQWGAARQDPRLMALTRPLACALFSASRALFSCWSMPSWSMISPCAMSRITRTARCRCGTGSRRPGRP